MTPPTDVATGAQPAAHRPPVRPHGASGARPLAVGLSAAAAAVPVAFGASGTALAEVPGDHHSPRVAGYATVALERAAPVRGDATARSPGCSYRAALRRDGRGHRRRDGHRSRSAMARAWASADVEHQKALLAALTQLGVPTGRTRRKPGVGFDCSGLTTYAWAEAGVSLPRQSGAQITAAAERDEDTAEAGDLVYYPGHVMMYLGVDDADRPRLQPRERRRAVCCRASARLRYGDPATDRSAASAAAAVARSSPSSAAVGDVRRDRARATRPASTGTSCGSGVDAGRSACRRQADGAPRGRCGWR